MPVVAKAGTGIGEFVTDGLDGLLADSDARMVDALVRLCREADLRGALAAHAHDHAGPVTWTRTLAVTDAAYLAAAALAGRGVGADADQPEDNEVAS